MNSPNILLHIKVVNDTTFSQFMTPISLIVIVPIMKVNYSETLTLNIDYYVCTVHYPFKPKYPNILNVNSKQIFG